MKHLEASFIGKNQVWRYLVMIVAVVLAANTVGAIPIVFFYIKALVTDPGAAESFSANPSDVTLLGVGPVTGVFLMLIPFLAMFFAYKLLVKPLNERSFMQTINGSDKFRWNRFFSSALLWAALSALYLFLYIGVEPENFRLNNSGQSLIPLIIVTFILIPFQSGSEELLMRGYLMQGFYRLVNRRWFPLVMTSLVFALLHSFNPEVRDFGFLTMMPNYFLFGLVFGLATILDDGAEVAMGAHIANNFFLSVMVTHKSSALQTPAVYEQLNIHPWTEFAGLLLMSAIFLIVLRWKFRWKTGFAS
ncbi:MAG: CPBP family intramembrane metalloprotease [Bacteroidales bacterium]|nr:CPBP family intramembrane metalloprotease [Bacteroidales bacterium]